MFWEGLFQERVKNNENARLQVTHIMLRFQQQTRLELRFPFTDQLDKINFFAANTFTENEVSYTFKRAAVVNWPTARHAAAEALARNVHAGELSNSNRL